jgi:hypothetical protein
MAIVTTLLHDQGSSVLGRPGGPCEVEGSNASFVMRYAHLKQRARLERLTGLVKPRPHCAGDGTSSSRELEAGFALLRRSRRICKAEAVLCAEWLSARVLFGVSWCGVEKEGGQGATNGKHNLSDRFGTRGLPRGTI